MNAALRLAGTGALALLLAGSAVAGEARPSAQIGTWSTALYVPSHRPQPLRALPPEAACIDAILEAERESGLHDPLGDHMLLAMGFTEAGRMTADRLFTVWPWTVNTEGVSRYFPTREDAIAFVREAQARGVRSIDVGCLQVNLRWHPDAFPDLVTAFDPRANVRYAARFLGELRRAHGTLDEAIARYHSAQSERGAAYRQRVNGNLRWVAHAIDYLKALAAGPQQSPAPAGVVQAWGKAELGRLSFLSSLYANDREKPLLPPAAQEQGRRSGADVKPDFTAPR